jgi:hypothetical protein
MAMTAAGGGEATVNTLPFFAPGGCWTILGRRARASSSCAAALGEVTCP